MDYDSWLLDQWEVQNAPDAWEHYEPGWDVICDYISTYYEPAQIADLVRDYLDGREEEMLRVYETGILSDYINPALQMKDPDEVLAEINRVFTESWENDDLFIHIWEHDDSTVTAICEDLLDAVNDGRMDKIREWYNSSWRE
jgi:hypothetical protein